MTSENYYNEIPLSDLQTLKRLKFAIESTNCDSQQYQELINKYHEELDDLCYFLDNPLAPEYEIEESLLPEGYLEFKESCLFSPPYTFRTHCQNKDAIALVQIKSLNRTRTKIHAKSLELYKGDPDWFPKNWCGNIHFGNASGWYQAHFIIEEKALVLLDKVKKDLFINGIRDKLIINQYENIALSFYRDKLGYWNGFNSFYTNKRLALNWKELHQFLLNLNNT